MARKPRIKEPPPVVAATDFRGQLAEHCKMLRWEKSNGALDLESNSKKYEVSFGAGISLAHAAGLLAPANHQQYRAPSREMINLIAHELAAFHEANGHPFYSRKNTERILNDLLRAAGFAPYEWANDRWDAIIDNPDPAERKVRVGYFPWPGMAEIQEVDQEITDVTGPSVELVKSLLRALQITTPPLPVKLEVKDLYDRNLFLRVDLVAPFVGIPARRLALAYSDAILDYRVGQNILVHKQHKSDVLGRSLGFAKYSDLPQEKIALLYIRGGVSELLVDELESLARVTKRACESFQEAIQRVAIDPQLQENRIPCFVGDSITCATALSRYPDALVRVLKNDQTMRCPLVFGLPLRPEVLQTVKCALDLVENLKREQIEEFMPSGVIKTNESDTKS